MITVGIDNIAQADNAYAFLQWQANPPSDNVQSYAVSYFKDGQPERVYTAFSVTTSLKIGSLYPGVTYWFSTQAQSASGVLGPPTTYQSATMPQDMSPPSTPTGVVAIKSLRGALVSCLPNPEGDIQGYLFQVALAQGPWQNVNAGPQLSTRLAYLAPSGSLPGTDLQFRVIAVDWAGNRSDPSLPTDTTTTDGLVLDELLAGNLTVYGTLTSGGFQTAGFGLGAPGIQLDGTGITLTDGSVTDYGGGPGVTFRANAQNGNGFFSGTLAATSVLTGGIQSGVANQIPIIPPNFTGFQLDPLYGLRFYNNGILQGQISAAGAIDMYAGTTLTVKDPNQILRVQLGQYVSVVDGTTQYGMQALDASGGLLFDTQGPHPWTPVSFTGWISGFNPNTPCSYRRIGTIVYLRGTAYTNSTNYSYPMFTLPIGYRPPRNSYYAVPVDNGVIGVLTILPSGGVFATGGKGFVSLDTVLFDVSA